MPKKKGQDFEELVEKLEKLLASGDIKVERNVRIPDKVSGGDRQIDVLLRIKDCHEANYASSVNRI